MTVINRPPHTAAIQGIMVIASIREVGECLVYLTSWLLCFSSGTSYTAEGRGRREGAGVVLRIQIHTQQVWWILFSLEGKLKLGWENKAVHSSVPLLNQTFTGKQQWHHILPSWILFFFIIVCFGLFLSNFSVEHCMKNAEDQVYTTLTETCVVLLLKHNFCLCLHKQKHTLMLLPDPCLNGSRYYPEISPLSRVLFSSQHVVHTSGLSSSSFTWSSAVYYLTEHEWHQNNSRGSQAWLPQCSVCDWAEVCNADLPLTFGLHIRTNTRRPLI